MALERVFDCPRTLRRLRTGPLGKLLEGFCHWLLVGGFTRGCIRKHLSNVSHLNEYLGRAMARPHATVTAKDIEGFFKAYPSPCRNQEPLEDHLRRVRYSIHRFLQWLGRQATAQRPASLTFESIETFFLSYAQAMGQRNKGTFVHNVLDDDSHL